MNEHEPAVVLPEALIVPDISRATLHWIQPTTAGLNPAPACIASNRLLAGGDIDEAFAVLRSSLRWAEDECELAGVLYNLAICHLRAGNPERCVAVLGLAAWMQPKLLAHLETDADLAALHATPSLMADLTAQRRANADTFCPLCDRPMTSVVLLYGMLVCRSCRAEFALRRCQAAVADFVLLAVFFLVFPGLLGWVAGLLQFMFKDAVRGQSPGKAMCGLRTLDEVSGRNCRPMQSACRQIGFGAPSLVASALWWAYVAIILREGYRPGDSLARTKVVWDQYADRPLFLTGDAHTEALAAYHDALASGRLPTFAVSPTTPASPARTCPNCGGAVLPAAVACGNCGAELI